MCVWSGAFFCGVLLRRTRFSARLPAGWLAGLAPTQVFYDAPYRHPGCSPASPGGLLLRRLVVDALLGSSMVIKYQVV